MRLLRLLMLALSCRFARSRRRNGHGPPVRPPSFRRTPTMIECRDGSMRPLVNASSPDFSVLRAIHPHCPSTVLEFRDTLPHCPDVSFCPLEFRAVSPCGDCCYICREPNEDFMAENAAVAAAGGNQLHTHSVAVADPCHNIKCKRHQKCVLNIQKIPVCRCFPVEMCSADAGLGLPVSLGGKKRKDKRLEKVCGNNGVSYETKCHMQVAACQANTHIRIAHKGACIKPAVREPAKPASNPSPSKNGRKPHRLPGAKQQQRQHEVASTPSPLAGASFSLSRGDAHPPPAIIVPIISPLSASSRGGAIGKPSGTSSSGVSSGAGATSARDSPRSGSKSRKTGRRDKSSSRSERQRGEWPRAERPSRIGHERIDRGKADRTEKKRNDRQDRGRVAVKKKMDKNGTRLAKSSRADHPKASKKIQRLERKKHKLEKRLMKEKEKVRRKQS